MSTSSFRRDERARAVGLAYVTVGFSKIATAAVQIIALPIVASSIGLSGFGAMMTIAGFASLLTLFAQGLGPATSFMASTAIGSDNVYGLRQGFWSSLGIALAGACATVLAGLIVFWWAPLDQWLDPEGILPSDSVSLAVLCAFMQAAMVYLWMIAEGVRAAHAQNHITNVYAFAASILVLCFCVLGVRANAGLFYFYIAIFCVPPAMQCLNLVAFLIDKRALLGAPSFARGAALECLMRTRSYAIAQAGFILNLQGVVIFSGTVLGLYAGAVAGAITRICILAQSSMLSLANPIFPLISKALGSGDNVQARNIFNYVVIVAAFAALLLGASLTFFGDILFRFWLGFEFEPLSPVLIASGLFFAGYSFTHMGYLACLAYRENRGLSVRYLSSGIATVTVCCLFARGGPVETAIVISAASLWLVNGTALLFRVIGLRKAQAREK